MVFARLKSLLSGVPTGVAFSIGLHAVLFGALFFMTGVVGGRAEDRQTAVVRAEAPVPPAESEPEIEPDIEPTPPPDTQTPEPLPEEQIPEEPPAFTEEFEFPLETEVLPPIRLAPTARPKPPVISVAPRAPAAAPPRPAPAPRPVARPTKPPEPKKTRAVPKNRPAPKYPNTAVRRELEGRVLLLVEVLPSGRVGEIKVHKSSGHGVLDRAAAKAVKTWSFRPAYAQNRPVRSWVEIPINFRLTN